ncbi:MULTISPECIES: hypothetical protein [Ralstonia]|uniref:hypothetical protein n=1 Tax=Ralstonia TaxID=48736 RepID=UPI0011AFBB5D|nr:MULTISPECIES: hypothetical protein [Ralstonia]QIF09770.1 hypothetical protein G5A69_19820 [Ralstonia mannitolilytica]
MEIVMHADQAFTPGKTDVLQRLYADWFEVRESHPAYHIHVILDPNHPVAPFDLLHPEHLLERKPKTRWARVDRPDFQHDPDICPLLVTVFSPGDHGYPDEALLSETIDRAIERSASVNGAYVCGWVACAANADELASQIAARCVVANPLTGRRVLPWFEPHRLALLADDDADILPSLLPPGTHWWFIDAAATVRSLSAPETDPAKPASVQQLHAMWAQHDRIADARRVLMALKKSDLSIPERPEKTLDGLVRLANEQGLRGQQDVIFFVLNCLTLSPFWYEHPNVQTILQDIRTGSEDSLAETIAAQPDVVLDEIASYGIDPVSLQ